MNQKRKKKNAIKNFVENVCGEGNVTLYSIKVDSANETHEYAGESGESRSVGVNNREQQNGSRNNREGFKVGIRIDAEGNILTEQQVEQFKDSKVRDGKGNLKVMYCIFLSLIERERDCYENRENIL